ncbi:MAG: hypothetical protein WD066_14940 [Planctomycetaceae bacterium]
MTTDTEPSGDESLMPAEMADAWAAVYLDVAETLEAEEYAAKGAAITNAEDDDCQPDG